MSEKLEQLKNYFRISSAKNERADALSKLVSAPALKLRRTSQVEYSFVKDEVGKTWVDNIVFLIRGNYQTKEESTKNHEMISLYVMDEKKLLTVHIHTYTHI